MLFSKHEQEEQTMFDQQRIGANIMKARKAKGLTQMALADGLNVSFQAVSNWERGQTCPDLSAIAPFLDSAVLGELVQRELKQGKRLGSGELAALLPFLDSEFIETYLEGQV